MIQKNLFNDDSGKFDQLLSSINSIATSLRQLTDIQDATERNVYLIRSKLGSHFEKTISMKYQDNSTDEKLPF